MEAGPMLQGVSFPAPGTYTVEVVVTAEGCERDFETEVEVLFDPSVAFDGGPVSGCPPLPVSFENFSETETAATYLWNFGDGNTSNAPFPSHVYELPGSYTVTLEMSTGGYCVQDLAVTQTAFVEVYPVPTAGFSIEPSLVDILEPVVQVEDLSEGAVQHYYNFGDGGSSTSPSGTYIFQGAGVFDVTQTVINGFGCTSTAQGEVGVNGTLFYAPNSFTPNNDGVNDVWMPTATGLAAYQCKVYNRWGDVVFETTDAETGWMGNVKLGDHYAPDGIYMYDVYLEDQLRIPFTYSGQIQLVR
jgi:gliding motility-associated-like protein